LQGFWVFSPFFRSFFRFLFLLGGFLFGGEWGLGGSRIGLDWIHSIISFCFYLSGIIYLYLDKERINFICAGASENMEKEWKKGGDRKIES
jgi:hypothetical protein